MKTFKSFEKYLNSLGYFISDGLCYEVVNGILYFVTFDNKEYGTTLKLRTIPNAAYRKELDKLSDGDEVEINPYDYDVNGAYIPCSICNIAGFVDNCKDGISLVDVDDGYNPHLMKDFKKCVWIQNHVMEQEEFILKSYIRNMKRIKDEFLPILERFDFYQYYSSILDCKGDESEFSKSSSNPLIVFKHKTAGFNENTIYFETDCINGKLKVQHEYYTSDDFENYIINNVMKDKYNNIEIDYKYLFDSRYKPNTWQEALKIHQIVNDVNNNRFSNETIKERIADIDLSALPYEDYKTTLVFLEKIKNDLEYGK